MALSRTTYTQAAADATVTTGSFTPPDNSLLVIVALVWNNDANGATISDTAGLTWTSRLIQHSTLGFQCDYRIWTAPVTTGASMTVTVARSSAALVVFPIAYTGYNTSTPTGATGGSDAGPRDGAWNMALSSASASSSEVIAIAGGTCASSGDVYQTIGSGWTSLFTANRVVDYGVTVEAFAGAKSNAEWADILAPSSTDTYNGGVTFGAAIEIVAAAGGFTSRLSLLGVG